MLQPEPVRLPRYLGQQSVLLGAKGLLQLDWGGLLLPAEPALLRQWAVLINVWLNVHAEEHGFEFPVVRPERWTGAPERSDCGLLTERSPSPRE
jgi:hypothetical protein